MWEEEERGEDDFAQFSLRDLRVGLLLVLSQTERVARTTRRPGSRHKSAQSSVRV